jgi:hypothetical protein
MTPLFALFALPCCFSAPASAAMASPSWIAPAPDGNGFVRAASGEPFIPWGFNYDRDYKVRLIEEYWDAEWATLAQDFREIQELGANVARVHVQFPKFMDGPDKPNAASLARLEKLVRLAEGLGVYIDLTGLGSYRAKDDPAWYLAMPEPERWAAQACFWESVAKTLAERPGVFAYNLMNEPCVAGEARAAGQWVHPSELAGIRYVEFVCLDPAGRERTEVARQWIRRMAQAIRKRDKRHMITVGIALADGDKGEEAMGFTPSRIAPELDYISVHLYPHGGQVEAAIDLLRRCKVAGKPLIIEEMFPLACGVEEFRSFVERSRGIADGWIGFFWGQTPAELRAEGEQKHRSLLAWLQMFQEMNPNRR